MTDYAPCPYCNHRFDVSVPVCDADGRADEECPHCGGTVRSHVRPADGALRWHAVVRGTTTMAYLA